MLDKIFNPKNFESKHYSKTEDFFACQTESSLSPFTLMMPPPNVTGTLHLGHALTYTMQDILIRYKRMQGFDALWQPGTDHAGIATQMVVERNLAAEGKSRHDLGREKFLEKVWEWKQHSGDIIVDQQRRLGISADWKKSRFTMDEGMSKAVTKVFVELYEKGLIYRAKRLVNWDYKLQTAISDLEVINQEQDGFMYQIFYPVVGSNEAVVVATTRPETLFGDVAVAVNPEDDRYKNLIGGHLHLPLTNRTIPIIADEYCDPSVGTGAVKITPAHDFNDFAVGERHNLPKINILDANTCLNQEVPEMFQGLRTDVARTKVLEALKARGLLKGQEKIRHTVPHGDRSGVAIQPWLTDQWFVDAKTLAQPAISAVKEGQIKFVPEQWNSTYFEWLNNIQPWCISRQIWWGHQIPAWFGPDGHIFVAEDFEAANAKATAHYKEEVELTRDQDVLDTWFSSALWPFSTLGWPDNPEMVKRYYPTSVLVTGFDIIFFWVARMIMMGMYFTGDVPFKTVYIHALVRDENGNKMSKSKGNIINPLDMIDSYGADALRFTFAALAAPGRDIKLGITRIEGYRNFLTKIWNAARFLQMNDCKYNPEFNPTSCKHPLSQWVISNLNKTAQEVTKHLEDYRFDLASQAAYQFVWNVFCDVYVECLKPMLGKHTSEQLHMETRQVATFVFMEILKIMNPFTPLVTEELWHAFYPKAPMPLMKAKWPAGDYFASNMGFEKALIDNMVNHNTAEINKALALMEEIRSLKGLFGVAPTTKIPLFLSKTDPMFELLDQNSPWICHLARLEKISPCSENEDHKDDVPFVFGQTTLYLRLGKAVNLQEAYQVLRNKHQELVTEIARLNGKLQNEAFKQAKPALWQQDKELLEIKTHEKEKLTNILAA